MDQCHDCGEVVCKSCGTLLKCKFCGSALCEECATSCAKCGIVLCGRDAKFAVDCDTCKLSYCLVCLASGQKETCIRCHTRPSKRMEQLVHLRLKSIYKAFQLSARINDAHPHLKRVAMAAIKDKKEPKMDPVLAKARADAAAAELLAELEQEEEDSKQLAKKKRKKKKKGQDDHGVSEADDEDKAVVKGAERCANRNSRKTQQSPIADRREEQQDNGYQGPSITEISRDPSCEDSAASEPKPVLSPDEAEIVSRAMHDEPHSEQPDPMQTRLCELVNAEDIEGIGNLLEYWKGVPGMAALRKNAKKALKRLKYQRAGQPQPRVKIISTLPKSATTQEALMEMDSSIVGFVIGKGGRKIRDLMDESGAKVWIDQDSMEAHEPRIVYVSGAKKAVDVAVKMIQDIVKEADNAEFSTAPFESLDVHGSEGSRVKPIVEAMHAPPRLPLIRDRISCEARFVPLLIGRRGWTIKQIQDASGAKVNIDQSVTPRIVTVLGTAESVEKAKRLISDVLTYPHAQLKTDADDNDAFEADGMHPPPPSTYVMTGDAKSIVSVSSSLSSTPEPSMSSSKGRELVGPPPGLFDNPSRLDSIPLAQRHVLSGTGFDCEQFVQSHFGNTHLQQPNLRQARGAPPPGHAMGGVAHGQQLGGHFPVSGQEPMSGMTPPHVQQQHAMHHELNQQARQRSMNMNPALLSQHQLAMHLHKSMSMPQQQLHNGFLSPSGNPNEAGMRYGGIGQPGDQRRRSLDLSFIGGVNDTHVQGMLHQPKPHNTLQAAYPTPHLPSHQSIEVGLAGKGSALLSRMGPLPSGSAFGTAVPDEGVFSGVVPMTRSGAREESNLIDSMFAPSTGDAGDGLLAGLKGLAVSGNEWECSSGLPEWKHDTKSRPPIESRFQWGS